MRPRRSRPKIRCRRARTEIDFSKTDKEDVQKEVKAVVQAMVDTLAAKQVRQVRADWAFRQRFEAARIATAQYNALSYAVRALPNPVTGRGVC